MKIEQMLHGYDTGHRLLAGSVLLMSREDMDTIATLSDWSEYVASGGNESSYVTAYPLTESGYYVIAKTWYAKEIKRPGCVWTHSLLIPFDLLNVVDDFKRLSTLFVRPSVEEGFDRYSHSIEYDNRQYSAADYQALTVGREVAASVLMAFLAGQSGSLKFSSVKDNQPYESLMLAAMTAVPMEMMRQVSWTTGTGYLRKVNGKSFTCQIISQSNEPLQKVDYDDIEPWIQYVVDALIRGDVNQGQLIRMFAEDIAGSVDYYSAIVKVLYTLEDFLKTGEDSVKRYNDVLNIIAQAFPTKSEGRIIKKLCASKTFSDRYCKDKDFFYLFATLPIGDVLNVEETGIDERWQKYISANHEEYLKLLGNVCASGDSNEWGLKVMKKSGDILTSPDIAAMIRGDYQLFSTIVFLSPSLLDKVELEVITSADMEKILPLILDEKTQGGFTRWNALFEQLLNKSVEINDPLAGLIFSKTHDATGILLDYINADVSRYVISPLREQLRRKKGDILRWLAGVDTITGNVAYAIVNVVEGHERVVVSFGARVWQPFLGLQYHNLRAEVYAFLFALSFNWPSDSVALALMRFAFEPLHELEKLGKLGYSNWAYIAQYMESVMIWEEWDKCKKMRKTVVKRLKRAGFDKSILDNYTTSKSLNEQLMKMW